MQPLISLHQISAELALNLKLCRNLESSLRIGDSHELWSSLGIKNKKQCEDKIQQLRALEHNLWPELEIAKIQAGII